MSVDFSAARLIGACLMACGLAACVQPQPLPAGAWVQAPDGAELVPPLPTFVSIADCEQAYGFGNCSTGAMVYSQASLPPPPDAGFWYMPNAYGLMTGALVHRHYAPPAPYRPTILYQNYVAPVVVQRYRVIKPEVVNVYRSAPASVQGSGVIHGPVPFRPHIERRIEQPNTLPPVPPVQASPWPSPQGRPHSSPSPESTVRPIQQVAPPMGQPAEPPARRRDNAERIPRGPAPIPQSGPATPPVPAAMVPAAPPRQGEKRTGDKRDPGELGR
jgi:hypothetical protein